MEKRSFLWHSESSIFAQMNLSNLNDVKLSWLN